MNDFILWHLAILILSAHFYIWDKNEHGVVRRFYIWFHNFTSSQEKQIEKSNKGFVYNQKTRSKVAFATGISLVFTGLLLVIPGAMSLPMEILMFFTEIPTITIGFFLGIPLEKTYSTLKSLMGIVDKVENNEIDISEEISDAIDTVKARVTETAESFSNKPNLEVDPIIDEPTPKKPSITNEEALEHLRNFNRNK